LTIGVAAYRWWNDNDVPPHGGAVDASHVTGYDMLWQRRLEAVAMFDAMDAESFSQTWWRAAAGMNWYVKRHDLKFSVMHRESFDEQGVAGARSHTTYIQAQFAF
jgi:phosphate-selective porin OprO and OprP